MGAYVDRLYLDLEVLVLIDSTKVDMIVSSSFLHDRCLKIIMADNAADISSSGGDIVADKYALMQFSEQDVTASAIDLINGIPNHVVDGKTVKEWFRYGNTSFWWFVHPVIYPKMEDCIRFVDQFQALLVSVHPELVEVRGFYDKMDLIEQICRKADVRVSIPLSSKIQIAIHRIKTSIKKIRLNRIASQKESKRLGLARQLGHQLQGIPHESTIFVLPAAYRRDLHDFHNGKDFRGEFIVHGIIDELKKRDGKILCIDVDYTLRGEMEKLKERLLEKDQLWAPLESFTTDEIRSTSKRATGDVLGNVRMLLRNPQFHRTLDYNGIGLWKTMQPHFEILLADQYIPSYARCIETAKRILAQLKPRSLFLPYETGPYAKSFIVASKELGITSIGIQHGIIYDKNPDYNHYNLDDSSNLGSPIPSIMLVFGDFSRQLLIGKSYPPERVVVVGHPEYEFDPDVLAADKRTIRQELGLDPSKEIILVATTKLQKKYGYEDYDIIMIDTLAKKLGNRSDIQIILKPHPLEDPAIYESIINEKAISNFLIRKDPIQRLILACDVFVTTMSTTAIEAIVLDRSVIIAQIPHNPLSFTLDGGAIGADLENLPDIALKVVKGEKDLVAELLQKRAEFKRRHFDFPNAGTRKKVADLLLRS